MIYKDTYFLLIQYVFSFYSIYLHRLKVNLFLNHQSSLRFDFDQKEVKETLIPFICKDCGHKIHGTIYCFMDSYYCSEFCRDIQRKDDYKIE